MVAALAGLASAIPASTFLQARAGLTLPSKDSFDFPGDLPKHKPGEILQQRAPAAAVAAFGLMPASLNNFVHGAIAASDERTP